MYDDSQNLLDITLHETPLLGVQTCVFVNAHKQGQFVEKTQPTEAVHLYADSPCIATI